MSFTKEVFCLFITIQHNFHAHFVFLYLEGFNYLEQKYFASSCRERPPEGRLWVAYLSQCSFAPDLLTLPEPWIAHLGKGGTCCLYQPDRFEIKKKLPNVTLKVFPKKDRRGYKLTCFPTKMTMSNLSFLLVSFVWIILHLVKGFELVNIPGWIQ